MIYIALLRGINVGGNNKIEMKKLKQTFEHAGMGHVTTYINSGNIIFSSQSGPTRSYRSYWNRRFWRILAYPSASSSVI